MWLLMSQSVWQFSGGNWTVGLGRTIHLFYVLVQVKSNNTCLVLFLFFLLNSCLEKLLSITLPVWNWDSNIISLMFDYDGIDLFYSFCTYNCYFGTIMLSKPIQPPSIYALLSFSFNCRYTEIDAVGRWIDFIFFHKVLLDKTKLLVLTSNISLTNCVYSWFWV